MKPEDMIYVVETEKSFEEAVVSVLRAIEQKAWTVFQVIDISERLAAKGFEQEPLKVIEICNGKHANHFLNKTRLLSVFMPCRINVFTDSGKTKIAAMKPAAVSQFFPEVSPEEAAVVESDIVDIVDSAK